jgi:hypothetical protein
MDIYEDEYFFIDEDKNNNKYYIGTYFIDTHNNILLSSTVSCLSFYKYNINVIQKYLYNMSLMNNNNNIHILKIDLNNNMYNVFIKTYWLRLIQKHFKKAYSLMKKNIIKNLYMYQINNYKINKINCIKGLLSMYK